MLGHKNMNLNRQFFPAPKNTITLQGIRLNKKNIYYLEQSKEIRSILLLINTENILFQHSEEAWHNPLAPTTSKKSYGTEQVKPSKASFTINFLLFLFVCERGRLTFIKTLFSFHNFVRPE